MTPVRISSPTQVFQTGPARPAPPAAPADSVEAPIDEKEKAARYGTDIAKLVYDVHRKGQQSAHHPPVAA